MTRTTRSRPLSGMLVIRPWWPGAAELAEDRGLLSGWVNNAAIFQDATLDAEPAPRILELIDANLALAVTGCHAAVNHYLSHKRAGAIVNVSSHQAQRPVRGAPPYGT